MADEFGLIVRFHLRADSAHGFDRLVRETLPEIAKHEPGTLSYIVHAVTGEPNQRVFYEVYADRQAFQAHEEAPHTRRFLAERGQYLESYEVDFVTPIADNSGSA
jgi:quinol monooxygenase YgiN